MIRSSCGLLVAMVTLAGTGGQAAQPGQLAKLYIVMAFDTNDADLKDSLLRDEKRMTAFWEAAVPAKRREITILKGDQVRGSAISQTIRALKKKVTAKDGIVFYFGGHGALVEKKGQPAHHVLRLTSEEDILRSSLRKMLEGCKAGLTVLLTDCCSTPEKYDGEEEKNFTARAKEIAPVVDGLFFRSRGVVDVTAASEEEAWSDDKNGGLFTTTLVRLLNEKPEKFGVTEDEAVSWEKFFPHLQKETQTFFKTWSKEMKARYPNCPIRAETQKPHAFFLGKQLVYGAVELENAKTTALKYKFRWEGDEEWTEWTLEPGKRFCHFRPAAGQGEPKKLEIWRDGARREDKLKPQVWDTDTAPKGLAFRYKIKK